MLKKILIITMMFNLAFSQGRLSGALGGVKDKLKKIEKEIKDNAALLSIKTPSNFDGVRDDMNKVFNIQKVKENTFQSMTKNENRSKSGWTQFGTIGDDYSVENLKSDWSQSLKSKKFGKRVYTRGYNFDLVVRADEKTSCECESVTEVKGRLLYWKWFSKYTDYLECEIVAPDGEKSKLIMEYSTYREKLPLTKRIASKLLPESLRDNGQRTKIAGKLKSGSKQYDVSSTYEYDLAFLGDKSPMSLIQPPVGYYISSSTSGEYFAVKDPSKFRISKNVRTSTEGAKLYVSLLATYFYYPHSKDFITLGGKKGLFGYKKLTGRMNDHFYDAKFRGAFGLF
tara:strand:- start:211 stop:1230 length:1020 start_codon:yes stop_codon:yes gene_type:complete